MTDFADRDPDLTYLQVGYLREYIEGELQLLGLDDLDEDPPPDDVGEDPPTDDTAEDPLTDP